MHLSDKQMRAIELNLEQQERLQSYRAQRLDTPVDMIVREFYAQGYEAYILVRISLLLQDLPSEFAKNPPNGVKFV